MWAIMRATSIAPCPGFLARDLGERDVLRGQPRRAADQRRSTRRDGRATTGACIAPSEPPIAVCTRPMPSARSGALDADEVAP
jgi:hypothetical protein